MRGGYIVTFVGHPFSLSGKMTAIEIAVQVAIDDLDAMVQKAKDEGGLWTEEKGARRHFLPWPFAHVHAFRHSDAPENVGHPLIAP